MDANNAHLTSMTTICAGSANVPDMVRLCSMLRKILNVIIHSEAREMLNLGSAIIANVLGLYSPKYRKRKLID